MSTQEPLIAPQEEQVQEEREGMTAPQVKSEPEMQAPMEKPAAEPGVQGPYDLPVSPAGAAVGQQPQGTMPQGPPVAPGTGSPFYGRVPPQAPPWNYSPPSAQPHRRWGFWILISLLVLFILLIPAAVALIAGAVITTSRIETRHFTVGSSPHIIVKQTVGSIHVNSGGSGSEVSVQATKWMSGWWGNASAYQVSYAQSTDGNTVTVTVKGPTPSSMFTGPGVALDLTIPANANLELTMNAGDIWVTGVSGQMLLENNTGSITMREGMLAANSSLTTNTGSITFRGSIEPRGNYLFSTNTGSIDVTVPSSAAFNVDASTNTGSISSDFPAVVITHNTVVGSQAHGAVGQAPSASMVLRTNTGSIHLAQGA